MPVDPTDLSQQPLNPYSSSGVPQTGLQLPRQKHSGMGVCSFIGAITSGLILFSLFCVIAYVAMGDPAVFENPNNPGMMLLVGLMSISLIMVSTVSIGLGIASLFQKDRKRVFGVLGLVFSLLMIALIGGLMVLGSV